jgi:L-threonylcarbamoyladenylate synthase
MEEDIFKAIEVLKKGGTILYPTDTIWGIGCDATNPEAVKKIYRIKKRDDTKSMLVLLDDAVYLSYYIVKVPEIAQSIIEVADKPLTIVYPGAKNLAENLVGSDRTIGIRITNDAFCKRLMGKFKKPLVSTSANISGKSSPLNFTQISKEIINSVDYVVKWRQDDKKNSAPSGIIKLGLNGEVEIIRK